MAMLVGVLKVPGEADASFDGKAGPKSRTLTRILSRKSITERRLRRVLIRIMNGVSAEITKRRYEGGRDSRWRGGSDCCKTNQDDDFYNGKADGARAQLRRKRLRTLMGSISKRPSSRRAIFARSLTWCIARSETLTSCDWMRWRVGWSSARS